MNKEYQICYGLNVISGPNAVGKSRLLELLKEKFSNNENSYFYDNLCGKDDNDKIINLVQSLRNAKVQYYIYVVSNDPEIIEYADNQINLSFDK